MWIAVGVVGGLILGWLLQWWVDIRFWRSSVPSPEDIAADKDAQRAELVGERQMFANELAQHTLDMNVLEAELANQVEATAVATSQLKQVRLDFDTTAADLASTELALQDEQQRYDAMAEEFSAAITQAKAKAAEAKAAAEATAEAVLAEPVVEYAKPKSDDDLQFINGIGPKLKDTLHKAGIRTFADMAEKTVAELQKVLDAAGGRFRLSHPDTWPTQAAFIRDGQYKQLQDYLEVA